MLEFRKVTRVYVQGAKETRALDAVDLLVERGDRVVMMGPSGSGKSTLLQLAAGIDTPSSGSVHFDGKDWAEQDEAARARERLKKIGFVFQSFNLLPVLSALENVQLPLDLAGIRVAESRDRASHWLRRVGLEHRQDHFPEQLSGGELQRVAIARAMISEPLLILADEPTGNLDSATGAEILDVLQDSLGEGRALIMVTHDPGAARIGTRHLRLADGRLAIKP